jgi:hypothetical protein
MINFAALTESDMSEKALIKRMSFFSSLSGVVIGYQNLPEGTQAPRNPHDLIRDRRPALRSGVRAHQKMSQLRLLCRVRVRSCSAHVRLKAYPPWTCWTEKSASSGSRMFTNSAGGATIALNMLATVKQIVSGEQTGADIAALDFALDHGIPHGGWCPRGRKAEDGTIDPRYRLQETPSASYAQRTEWNVRDSDGTVVFSIAPALAGGSKRTVELAHKHGRPVLHLARDGGTEAPEQALRRFISRGHLAT